MIIASGICQGIRQRDYMAMLHTLTRTAGYHNYTVLSKILPREQFFIHRLEWALSLFKENNVPMIISDVDVFVLRPFSKMLFDASFAVGLVYRCDWKQSNGRRDDVNAGLIYLNSKMKEQAISFAEELIKTCKGLHEDGQDWWYDQIALNKLAPEPRAPRSYDNYIKGIPFTTEIHKGIALLDGWLYGAAFNVNKTFKAYMVHYNSCVLTQKGKVSE